MSEAELHVLRARLQGGILNKARRGELEMRPPVGLVYNSAATLVLDPDQQVQHCLRWLFATFRQMDRRWLRQELRAIRVWPFHDAAAKARTRASCSGPVSITSHVLRILHNPRYAGAFVYGRTHTRKTIDGGTRIHNVPREQWAILIPGAHAGYLSWEEYEQNQSDCRLLPIGTAWSHRS